ncbi:MAG: hypothetical protein AAGA26_03965, partial [Pseudomonadota bacterium]
MPFTGLGSYSVTSAGPGLVDLAAGLDTTGSLTFTGGTYSVGTSFLAGINLAGSDPLSGLVRLTGGTDITFAPTAGASATVYIGADLSGSNSPGQITAYGYLDVFDGSTVDVSYSAPGNPDGSNTYASFVVGGTGGASGQINVDGDGSLLRSAGEGNRITLGLGGGQGTLAVTNRGKAETLSLQAGIAGGLGQVYLSGGSSELVVSSATGQYLAPGFAGQSGAAVFGSAGGAGFLGVAGGARITVENVDGETDLPAVRFALDSASYGYGVITGLGSRLTITQHGAAGDDYGGGAVLNVGEGGQGVLLADNYGRIDVTGDAARVNVASGAYVDGQPNVTNAESLLQLTGGADLTIDSKLYGGSALVDGVLQSDGRGAALVIGGGQQTTGRVIVDGLGSSIRVKSNTSASGDDATGQIIIGSLGTGSLEVRNLATVAARNIELGRSLNDGNSVVASGIGTLTVSDGGSVTVTTNAATAYLGLEVGDAEGSVGTVTVTGTGSELISAGGAAQIRVGHGGTGSLSIENGGRVEGLFLDAGRLETGSGIVEVDGVGSILSLSDAGGEFPASRGQAGLLRLGGDAGSYGRLEIANGGAVSIGNDPGSTADLPSLIVGSEIGSVGIVDLAGQGTSLDVSLTGSSTDGYAPSVAAYFGPRLRLGEKGGAGQVTVGDGAQIALTGENAELRVGEGTAGYLSDLSTFTIQNGGTVLLDSSGTESAAVAVVGRNEGGLGRVSVTGDASALTIRSDNTDDLTGSGDIAIGATLTVGSLGDGTLVVEDGGRVSIDGTDDAFPGLIVGSGSPAGSIAAVGNVSVSGEGSLIEVIGTNQGSPIETGFGEAGLIAVGLHAQSSGTLTVGTGAVVRNPSSNSVTLIAPAVQSVGTVRVAGDGALLAAGSVLAVAASVDFTVTDPDGFPVIDQATGGVAVLDIGADGRVEADKTVVGQSGTLMGTGQLASDLDLFGEILVGGEAVTGTLKVVGDVDISSGASIVFDIEGFDPTQADKLVVTGDITGAVTAETLLLE